MCEACIHVFQHHALFDDDFVFVEAAMEPPCSSLVCLFRWSCSLFI